MSGNFAPLFTTSLSCIALMFLGYHCEGELMLDSPTTSSSCMFLGHHCEGELMLHSPSDANVSVGEGVTFQCRLILCGNPNIPSMWIIGGKTYSTRQLPAGYEYTTEGMLRIDAVWESLNNTKFACVFILHAGDGNLSCIESSPACLLVYGSGGSNDSENQLPISSPIVTAWSNTTATINDTSLTIAVSTSSATCNSGEILTTKCETPASTVTPTVSTPPVIIVPVTVTVTVTVFAASLCVIIIVIVIVITRKNKLKGCAPQT